MKFIGALCFLLSGLLGLGAWMSQSELKEMETRAVNQSGFSRFVNQITGSTAAGREFITTGRRIAGYMWVGCVVMFVLGGTLADWDSKSGTTTTIITHSTETTGVGDARKPAGTGTQQPKIIDATLVTKPPAPAAKQHRPPKRLA